MPRLIPLLRRRLPIRRGAALPVVLIVVAVMTTVVVQFVHESRTNLHMAANVRDEVRAYYNAKAAIDLARLALGFQAQVDALAGGMNIQVYQFVNQIMGVFAAARIDTPVAAVDMSMVKGLGGMSGEFEVDIQPEDGKLNLNALGAGVTQRNVAIAGLTLLMSPAEHQELFERRDDKGNYNDIPELIASLIDWIDPDDMLTQMNADGNYLQGGGTGESSRFSDFDIAYKQRNMKLDTLLEAHLIKGIDDEWWDAFGAALTIYPSTKINVNSAPDLLLAVVICANLANPQDPFCDPFSPERLFMVVQSLVFYRQIKQMMFVPAFSNTQSFVTFLMNGGPQEMGLDQLVPPFEPPPLNYGRLRSSIETRSPKIYRIVARGKVGNTVKTLTGIIDITKKGRLYYWREF